MFTSKQRATLRGLAQNEEPVTQVGKSGVTDALIDSLDKAIEKRELIKITVLETSGIEPKQAAADIAAALSAEVVCVTGRKPVFYRKSKTSGVKHVEF